MSDEIRIAQVGVKPGGVPPVHLASIANFQNEGLVKLVSVADKNPNNDAVKGLVDTKVISSDSVYDDYRKMIDSEKLDAVVIATPHQFHLPMTKYALEKGLHVLCEKPPAVLAQDADEFVKIVQDSGKVVTINCMYTASETAEKLLEDLFNDVIGEVHTIVGTGKWCRTNEYYKGRDWAGKVKAGDSYVLDGAMFNQFPHLFRQMLFFTGEPNPQAETVQAELYRAHSPDILQMEGTGCVKTNVAGKDLIMYFTTSHGQDDPLTIDIYGTEGKARWTCDIFGENKKTFYRIDCNDTPVSPEIVLHGEDWGYMCQSLFGNFIDQIKGETQENYSPIGPAALHVKVVNAAYLSSKTGEGSQAIRQVPPGSVIPAKEAVGASGTGLKSAKKETKMYINGLDTIMDQAARNKQMYSDVPQAYWAQSSNPVKLADVKTFDPAVVLK